MACIELGQVMNHSAQLRTVDATWSDQRVAECIADAMLEIERVPYWFSIDYNPKNKTLAPCSVDYDWALKGRVGINTNVRWRAKMWLIDAALAGYIIVREGQTNCLSLSISRVRRMADIARQPESDDDIPF